MDEDKRAQMDAAAEDALQAWGDIVSNMESDEQHGAMELLRWIKGWYLKAGYRRLLRALFAKYEEIL